MSLVGAIGLVVVIALHTLIAAVGTRFLRIRMDTTWGSAIYALTVLPVVLLLSTYLLTGFVGIGTSVGGFEVALLLVLVLPLLLGYTIDVFWVPAPEELELPETAES